MLVEVGDALIGVESHGFFKVGSSHAFIVGTSDKGQAPPIALARGCSPKPARMTLKTMLLLAAAISLMPTTATAQPIDPKVQARIDRILKATPLIDGHNDIAEQLAENYKLQHRRARQRHRQAASPTR